VKFALFLALLSSSSALAVEAISEPIPEVVIRQPTDRSAHFALSVTAASLFSVGTSVLGGVIATSLPTFCTQQLGAPSPMCGVGAVALAGATQLLLSLLIIPELFRISGDDPGAVRAGWWKWARWPAAVLAASALMLLAGSASEEKQYGSGQGVMMGSLVGAAVSGVSVDVMGLIGAVKAAKAHR
jgi:hypothetical protein